MKSYVKICTLITMMVLILTGCGGGLPDMTPEEEQIVGEYAAKLLLKYDANNRSRLVSREEVAVYESELEQKTQSTLPEQTQSGMDPVDDTPVVEIGQETSGVVATGSFEEFYDLAEGIQILYQGHEICDSYPKGGAEYEYFTLDAEDGNKLLVLKFRVDNQSQTVQTVDILSKSGILRATVNGSKNYNVLTTMLMDDLSTYKEDVAVGESVDAVLLIEAKTEELENVSSISLNLKNDSKTCTIQLQ